MPTLRYRKYNPDGVWAHRMVWWRWVGEVPVCPPVSPHKGASIVQFPVHNACIFWYGNVATRTFGRAHRRRPYAFCLRKLRVDVRPYGFVWADWAWNGWFRLGGLRVGGFVCWENGAHEPTPSVLYFCQPRVADDRRLPWVKSWRGTYAIGIVLFKINFRMRKSFTNNPFAACGNDVR